MTPRPRLVVGKPGNFFLFANVPLVTGHWETGSLLECPIILCKSKKNEKALGHP